MTLVVIGPVTNDLIIIANERSESIGGATYFQSFVFEEFYSDYIALVNCSDEGMANDFPNPDKVKVIMKDNTHFFINDYPQRDNRDIRVQSSNFADIPILESDLKDILPEKIDAFVLNPLNRNDFPLETVEYLKGFGVPIFMSVQGFLRTPGEQLNENYAISLDEFDKLSAILSGVNVIFLDESERNMICKDCDIDEIVITDGSNGSRILCGEEIKIEAVKCDNVVDTTGCGDTYMAAYITQRLMLKSPESAGNFASIIASRKLENSGPYNFIE